MTPGNGTPPYCSGSNPERQPDMNKPPTANKGPWSHRFLVHLFTVILAILIYWLLGFAVRDIGSWPGPSYDDIESRQLDSGLVDQLDALNSKISETAREIDDQKQRQTLLHDSTVNSQRTMNQLLEIQRLSLQKEVAPLAEEQKALAESERLFLANQGRYQRLNEDLARLNEQLRDLEKQNRGLEDTLEEAREPVRKEYDSLVKRHNLIMAAWKLAVLTPLLVIAAFLLMRKRGSIYVPMICAFGIAVLLKVAIVMHEHFPSRYFKYVLILTTIAIAVRILVYLLRMAAFPKKERLLKQYREAYEAFLCPICGYLIRRGPLKYLSWTRRSIRKLPRVSDSPPRIEEAYTCPACSTRLYEECDSCHAIRHSLLPSCDKCGATKTEKGPQETS